MCRCRPPQLAHYVYVHTSWHACCLCLYIQHACVYNWTQWFIPVDQVYHLSCLEKFFLLPRYSFLMHFGMSFFLLFLEIEGLRLVIDPVTSHYPGQFISISFCSGLSSCFTKDASLFLCLETQYEFHQSTHLKLGLWTFRFPTWTWCSYVDCEPLCWNKRLNFSGVLSFSSLIQSTLCTKMQKNNRHRSFALFSMMANTLKG